jgi:hypothetical protein
MLSRIRLIFLLLVITQGFQSIEEYLGKLWEVFAPASFLSSLVSNLLKKGFLIINTGLFVFGLVTFFSIRKNYIKIRGIIWFWISFETINGIGHPIWAFFEKAYVPGLIAAPFLLFFALYLAKLVLTSRHK